MLTYSTYCKRKVAESFSPVPRGCLFCGGEHFSADCTGDHVQDAETFGLIEKFRTLDALAMAEQAKADAKIADSEWIANAAVSLASAVCNVLLNDRVDGDRMDFVAAHSVALATRIRARASQA
jgi:hypothetical protein